MSLGNDPAWLPGSGFRRWNKFKVLGQEESHGRRNDLNGWFNKLEASNLAVSIPQLWVLMKGETKLLLTKSTTATTGLLAVP